MGFISIYVLWSMASAAGFFLEVTGWNHLLFETLSFQVSVCSKLLSGPQKVLGPQAKQVRYPVDL